MKQDSTPILREIAYGSNDYRAECSLRDEVLRQPLELSLYDQDLSGESAQRHFGLYAGGELIACLIAAKLSNSEVKLRQMAVRKSRQGQGYGTLLVQKVEIRLREDDFVTVSLHARAHVMNFYIQLGYEVVGDEFIEVGIPHYKMSKQLVVRQ